MESLEQWQRRGITLGYSEHQTPWLLGEWWASGEAWSRERTHFIRHHPEWRGIKNTRTLANYASTWRQHKGSLYRDTLSLTHHALVSGLPVEKAAELLAQAEANKLTSAQMGILANRLKSFNPPPGFEACTIQHLDQAIADGWRYGAILADPPWETVFKTGRWSVHAHYQTLALDQICAMPVGQLADDDSHLHLWCPNHLLPMGLAVIDAWGFEYKTKAVWRKTGRPGTGNYYRNITEDLLLGVRGKATRFLDGSVVNCFDAPRGRHSEKPPVHAMIERCSPGPYLELFARSVAPGWSAWGDQVDAKQFKETRQ